MKHLVRETKRVPLHHAIFYLLRAGSVIAVAIACASQVLSFVELGVALLIFGGMHLKLRLAQYSSLMKLPLPEEICITDDSFKNERKLLLRSAHADVSKFKKLVRDRQKEIRREKIPSVRLGLQKELSCLREQLDAARLRVSNLRSVLAKTPELKKE